MTRLAFSVRLLVLLGMTGLCLTPGGCAPTVVPASSHAASHPSLVALYQDPPSRYEDLGIIKTDGTFVWDQVGQMQGVIEELKAKAAALGANGLLLQVPEYRLKATGTYNEEHYQIPIDRTPVRAAMATAIFVHKK